MKYRKLRFAISAACGIACLLLIAMQLRSHWVNEGFSRIGSTNYYTEITSLTDGVRFYFGQRTTPHEPTGWKYTRKAPRESFFGFRIDRAVGLFGPVVPYWFLILIAGALAGVSAVRPYKVSLRTLLIVTTLSAVVLGIIVYPATQ